MTTQDYINNHKTSTFKKGDKVIMVDCHEADYYKDKEWTCLTDSYISKSDVHVVHLEGFAGAFAVEYLKTTMTEEATYKTGIELIAEERKRQVDVKNWTANHDDNHTRNELAIVAMCYVTPPSYRPMLAPTKWFNSIGWDVAHWNPGERIMELQKAGALIAAEIDRLQRIKSK